MIDLHCHLLPGIDDGPDTMDQALELARLAVDNGITHSVLTPHIHPGRWENRLQGILKARDAYQVALREEGIPLKLGFAAELRLSSEVLILIQQRAVPYFGTVNGYKILLLELPHSHVPPGSDKLVQWLLDRKIRPMIAHPERNKDIMRDYEKIEPFVEMGCFFQVTAGSVAGTFGEPARQCAEYLLEQKYVTILASDAHNVQHRPPRLDHGRDAAAGIVGQQVAMEMVRERPARLVRSQFADL